MAYVAREPFTTGNIPPKFRTQYESLCFVNTGSSDLTIYLYSEKGQNTTFFSFVVSAGEVFDELVDPFEVLTVSGSGSYKGFVREEK